MAAACCKEPEPMPFHHIESTKNPLIRRFRAAAAGEAEEYLVADGVHLAEEVLQAGLGIQEAVWSPKLLARGGGEELLQRCRQKAAQVHECADKDRKSG